MLLSVLIILAAVLWLILELGWFTPLRPWPRATGWNRIPMNRRAPVSSQVRPDGPEIFWLGHSGFVIHWAGETILLDPNTAGRCTVSRRFLEPVADVGELGPVSAVIISHAHFDHLDLNTLRSLKRALRVIVPAGSEDYITGCDNLKNIIPIRVSDSVPVGPLEVIAVPAAHNGHRYHPWRSDKNAVGYVIRDGRDVVYFAGDTCAANDFAGLRERYHPTFAILPIGAFSPRRPLKDHHLSPEETVAAAQALGVETMMPCHFGTFRLSLDRTTTALPRFARAAQEAKLKWIMPSLWKGPHGR